MQDVSKEYLTTQSQEKVEGQASGIAFPTTTEEVQALVKQAYEEGNAIIPVGARTGLTSATYPTQGEYLIGLEKMNKIIGMDEDNATLTVQAGVTLGQIINYLEDTDYFYAPDPGSKNATIGGMAATNAGGMTAIKYGVTRDNIVSFTVVLPNGNVIRAGSNNKKNASGYDLKNLFIGAEGTLGIMTEVDVLLRPRTTYEQSILIGFNNLDDVSNMIVEILNSNVLPKSLEVLEKDSIATSEKFVGHKLPEVAGEAHLLMSLDGDNTEVIDADVETLRTLAQASNASGFLALDEENNKLAWNVRDNILTAIASSGIWKMYDPVVPNNRIADLINQAKDIANELEIVSAFFGHAGDGNIHICLLNDGQSEADWDKLLDEFEERTYQLVSDLGGLPAAEHGIGLERRDLMQVFFTDEYIGAMKAIKDALDPKGIMNPGKLFE